MEENSGVQVVESDIIAAYQIFAMPSDNQAESLASYLVRHGFEAAAAGNEVTCPSPCLAITAEIFQLLSHWQLFWRFFEKELYGLPVYTKPACNDHHR